MSKKLSRRYVAVFSRTLDETASRLEDVVNRLVEEGYLCTVEPKDTPASGEGFGYMVHAILHESEQPRVPSEVIEAFEKIAAGHSSGLGERSAKFLDSLLSKMSVSEWGASLKEIPTFFPQVISGYTATDIREMKVEFESALSHHDADHKGNVENCPFHKAMKLIISLLGDNERLHLQ